MSDPSRLSYTLPEPLPIAQMVIGKPAGVVATMLPRLFNLCRVAQAQAVGVALGLDTPADVATEILRDHLLKLFVTWPELLGLGSRPLPGNWSGDSEGVLRAIFGPAGEPVSPVDFGDFLLSGQGVAPVLRAIDRSFGKDEATCALLPLATPETIWSTRPMENSVAMRHANNPSMRAIETARGRGPLWRAAARVLDVAAVYDKVIPAPYSPEPGVAVVSAARGAYGLKLKVDAGVVTDFARVTPTDTLIAPGGVLEQTLASIDPARAGLAALVIDILDPCVPIRLQQGVMAGSHA